tara:strand:+ start:5316 stop:5624 length:309 start_codon:yes stop_codon:yes gene_type:complete
MSSRLWTRYIEDEPVFDPAHAVPPADVEDGDIVVNAARVARIVLHVDDGRLLWMDPETSIVHDEPSSGFQEWAGGDVWKLGNRKKMGWATRPPKDDAVHTFR